MPILLTEGDVLELLTMERCIRAVEEAFVRQAQGKVANLPRRRLRPPRGVLHCMEAADQGLGRMGLKVYTSFRPRARFLVLLYDSTNGDLLAVIEADRLGQMRTGAATGVATRYMARQEADVLCLFGTGWQAESQALAAAAVRPLKRIQVYSRDAEKRSSFAAKMQEAAGVESTPAESPESALKGAGIVVTATTSRKPVFDGRLLEAGVHVNAVGSNSLSRAEIDSVTVERCSHVVVDAVEQSKLESGDLLAAIESNRLRWEEVIELKDVVSGQRKGRDSDGEITLFKSNGLALEDIAAASLVYDLAIQSGIGKQISLWDAPA